MDIINAEVIKRLMSINENPSISIYMPTHKEWNYLEEDMKRFKNMIKNVEKSLAEREYRTQEIEKFLKPAKEFLNNREFWNHQTEGLAMFITKDEFFVYHLPANVKEHGIVSKRFYIKPLLQILSADGRFFILALDQKELKLYQGTRYSINEIQLPKGTPVSLEEVMQWDDPEKSLQFHTGTGATVAQGKGGSRAAIFHGHGNGGLDDAVHKQKILEFFHMVDKGVFKIIGKENVPLVLTGVEFLIPIYRKANSYSKILDESIHINPENLSLDELHKKAYEVVRPLFEKNEKMYREKYERFSGDSKASGLIDDIVKSAYAKKIESLFVDINAQHWGYFDVQNDEVISVEKPENGYEDLLDYAAVHTLLNGGNVYAVERERMPNHKEAAAVYRF